MMAEISRRVYRQSRILFAGLMVCVTSVRSPFPAFTESAKPVPSATGSAVQCVISPAESLRVRSTTWAAISGPLGIHNRILPLGFTHSSCGLTEFTCRSLEAFGQGRREYGRSGFCNQLQMIARDWANLKTVRGEPLP
jgi:hypothetical protein